MVIHTNLPFIVNFNVYSNNGLEIINNKSFSINQFYDNDSKEIEDFISFYEYDYLKVEFKAVNLLECLDAKLYMDYFEYLAEDNGDIKFDDDNNSYININNEATIHTHMNNYTGIPLIPGIYKYKIEHKNNIYYGKFEILPKNIDKKMHYKMIEDIEEISLGLSRDFYGQTSIHDNIDSNFAVSNIDKILYIINNKIKFLNAIHILKVRMEKKIESKYRKLNKLKNVKYDYKSVKLNTNKGIDILRVNRGEIKNVYQKIAVESVDTNENRFLLFVLKSISKIIYESKQDILNLKSYIDSEISSLTKYKNNDFLLESRIRQTDFLEKTLIELNNINTKILEFNFFNLNKANTNYKINTKILRTPGYRELYYFYKELNNGFNELIGGAINYKWKTTDLIYEYWCFIELVNYLREVDFEIISGRIFNDNKRLIKYEIEEGTTIVLRKADIDLKLIYNKEIKKYKSISEDYWTRDRHNKPDFRLDVYKSNLFSHTIILDSKYSPAEKIWKKNRNGYGQQTKVVTQLNMYKNMIVSTKEKDKYVVKEVIALTPTLFDDNREINIDENYSVTVATFNPSKKNNNLIKRLEFLIAEN